MSDLFSHAVPDRIRDAAKASRGRRQDGTGSQPPEERRATGRVAPAREQAWEGFTEYIHLWWPAEHTRFGQGTHVELTSATLSEESDAGDHYEWARVASIEPRESIELDWTLGWETSSPSRVRISFEDDAVGTRITVIHDGWLSGPDGIEQSRAFNGWTDALDSYSRFMGTAASGGHP